MAAMIETSWRIEHSLDVGKTLRFVVPKDRQLLRLESQRSVYALSTPDGPATVTAWVVDNSLLATATGDGAEAALAIVPRTLGLDDNPNEFLTTPGLLRDLHRRNLGFRLGSTGRVFDSLLPTVIGQRVTTDEAKSSYRRLIAAIGEPAPGDLGLRIPPRAEVIANMEYTDMHRFGIERSRAQIVIEVARRARRLEQIVEMNRKDGEARLAAVRGIGAWTIAQVMGSAWGDRDAVPTGDYHLPNTISWALAGEPRASDERMLELLEIYRPLRRRAMILVKMAGVHAPRYGERTAKSAIGRD